MAQTIYNPEYMGQLRTQIINTGSGMDAAFGDLRAKYEAHGGLWEDALGGGPCETFGVLVADFQKVMTNFLNNLETTTKNVDGYDEAMTQVSNTFNFAGTGA